MEIPKSTICLFVQIWFLTVDDSSTDFFCIYNVYMLTIREAGGFGDFRQKKHLNARGFAHEYLRSCSL